MRAILAAEGRWLAMAGSDQRVAAPTTAADLPGVGKLGEGSG